MRWLVPLSLLGACAPTPPLATGGIDPAQVEYNGAYLEARSGPLVMRMGTPPEIQMPVILVASPNDMTNLLAPAPATNQCGEGYVGINLSPAARASAATMVGMSSTTTLLQGPAVARFSVEYKVPYECNGLHTLSGTSIFTMLPSGRIERLDDMVIGSSSSIPSTAGECGCAQSATEQFLFSSFWSFRSTAELTAGDANRTDEFGPGCTLFDGQTIAVKYDKPSEQQAFNGTHLVYFAKSTPFMLTEPQRSRSSIVITPGPSCSGALKKLEDPTLIIDGKDVTTEQGIYVDTAAPHTKTVRIGTNFALPDGFALQINLAGATHARVLKDGLEVGYTAELDGEHPVFWFNTDLQPNSEITIEPVYD
jgi:hypothetical protein